ncbi:PREDICTED: uncharacterized protein LOC109154180 [Ipomoea nil]|uniref:uncharacterized protein LOC109154180 n=1 Tax=Ipomoea nil TaxID=35883 RepID=UPI000900DD84|nr:PREDICTED: uncharacterized protein LOC109154180 [Ipomoea nil]
MEIYLQAQGTRVYRTVLSGWSQPTIQNPDGTTSAKPIETWTENEMTASDLNNKALNSIVGSLHESVFTLVTGVKEAKRVWEILETRYEGISDVKQSKLQMVLSEFEALRMSEEETISVFHSRVQNLMNRASILSEPFTDEIEHTGWEKKSLGELMGSLHTYELELLADDDLVVNRKGKKKAMSVATLSDDEEEASNGQSDVNVGNFVAFFSAIENQSEGNESDEESYISTDDFEGRHTQLEMEFAKLVASWEQLVKANKNLNEDLKQRDDLRKKLNTELVTKEDLITQIRSREGKMIKELDDLKKNIKMMDTTSTLDKILDSGRNPNDKKDLGYKRGESSKTIPVFVKEGVSIDTSARRYEIGQSSRSVQIKEKGKTHAETDFGRVASQSQY